MINGLAIRRATEADNEFAYQTKKAAFKEYVDMVWGWKEQEQHELHERRFAAQDFSIVRVLDADVGILAVVREADSIKVNQMMILPEWQGRGIGEACMKIIIADANATRIPIKLQVLKVNPRAQAFYQRFGFVAVGETATHILMEKPPNDAPGR